MMEATTTTVLTSDCIAQYLRFIEDCGRRPATVKSYGGDLRALVEFAEANAWCHDDERMAALFITTHRGDWAVRTTNRRISAIRAFGMWAGAPLLQDFKQSRAARPRAKALTGGLSSITAMLKHFESEGNLDMIAVVALCGFGGLRVGEAEALERDHLDFHDRIIEVWDGKGGNDREVPMAERAVPWLRKVLERDGDLVQISRSTIERHFRAAAVALGESQHKTHSMRATALTTWHRNGASLRTCQELAGHASARTTEVYTDATMDDMRAAVNS